MLNKKAIGLDITDHSITVVELVFKQGQSIPESVSQVRLPAGIVVRGVVKDEESLIEALDRAFDEAYPSPITDREVVFGIPDTQVYLHTFSATVKTNSPAEFEEMVEREIDATIPISSTNRLVSVVRNTVSTGEEILIVAVVQSNIENWRRVLSKAGISVLIFDIPAYAILRSMQGGMLPKGVSAIVDIGAYTTSGIVFDESSIRYSYVIPFAGGHVTKHVADSLRMPISDAERQKQIVGLSDKNDPIFTVLAGALEPITKSLLETFDYLARDRNIVVSGAVLMGGSSALPGIREYFNENLSLPVIRGLPNFPHQTLMGDSGKHPEQFILAFGLARRLLDDTWKSDPQIVLSEGGGGGFLTKVRGMLSFGRILHAVDKFRAPKLALPKKKDDQEGAHEASRRWWLWPLTIFLLVSIVAIVLVLMFFFPRTWTYKKGEATLSGEYSISLALMKKTSEYNNAEKRVLDE